MLIYMATTDCKEGFNIGEDPFDPSFNCPADFDVTPYEKFGAGQINLWPEKPEAFRSTLTEYRQAIERFAKQLLRIVALALDLEETYFDHMGRFPMAGLRPLHYPVQEVSDDVGIGMCSVGMGGNEKGDGADDVNFVQRLMRITPGSRSSGR